MMSASNLGSNSHSYILIAKWIRVITDGDFRIRIAHNCSLGGIGLASDRSVIDKIISMNPLVGPLIRIERV